MWCRFLRRLHSGGPKLAPNVSPLTFWSSRLEHVRKKEGYIVDMDGVLTRGNQLIPGADLFLDWIQNSNKRFVFLTNSSDKSPVMIREKFKRLGVSIPAEAFFTSAMATAQFLANQNPAAKAFVIGEPILKLELQKQGFMMDDVNPDYVVIGETPYYTTTQINHATNLVYLGAKLIGTNRDVYDPVENGHIIPSVGAWISVIEKATGVTGYFVGKPNPLMIRTALSQLDLQSKDCAVIGDRMDTDIIAGVESMIDTILVLSGVTRMQDLEGQNSNKWSWCPYLVLDDVGAIVPPSYTLLTHKQPEQ